MDSVRTDKQKNQPSTEGLENGSYEIIKNRLNKYGSDLKTRLEQLNTTRKDVFGALDTSLIGSERIITDNNCVPRDMAPVGNSFIFGYNVHMGLKSKVELQDVFSIYEYKNRTLKKLPLDIIQNEKFINDFDELYKYYKNTFFQNSQWLSLSFI